MQIYGLIFNYGYGLWIIFNVLEQDTRSVYDNVNDDNAAELQFKD